jgi:hypothetical protein
VKLVYEVTNNTQYLDEFVQVIKQNLGNPENEALNGYVGTMGISLELYERTKDPRWLQ